MNVMELLQLYGIPLPAGLAAIIVILSVLYVVCMRFLDNKASVKPPKTETAPVNTVFAAADTGNSAIVVAISAAVNEYRKNN